MNITDRLKQEHMEILSSLNDLLNRPIDDAERYSKAYLDVMMMIEAHERGEERTIYEAIASDLEIRPVALQAMEEHRVARQLFKDLADVEITEELWLPKLVVANNFIALHSQIEEGNVFPILQQMFDDARMEQFDKQFMAEKEKVMQVLRS